MREILEFQADQIEAVLTQHKAPGRVAGGTVTPRWVRFKVFPSLGTRISKVKNLSEELAAALDPSSQGGRYARIILEESTRLEKALSEMTQK